MLKTISLLCCFLIVGHAAQGNGSISGRVTVQGKPLAGIVLGLHPQSAPIPLTSLTAGRAVTNAEGDYQFRGIAAGSYQINVLNPLYVIPTEDRYSGTTSITITVGDDEDVTNANLSLVRGGIVTGKVVDAEGRPLIEQFVQLDRLDARGNFTPGMNMNRAQYDTDDRGIYRIIGLIPGRYRVSAGEGEGSVMRMAGRKSYPRTFHPDTTDAAQAKIVEVGEGSEVTGVDIQLSPPVKTYTISGRAVDAETNEPVANLGIAFSVLRPDGRMSGTRFGNASGANGEFRVEGVRPGRYGIVSGGRGVPQPSEQGYSDQISVDVVDGDVTGVEIRVKRGGSISGSAIVEGTTDPAILAGLSQQRLMAMVQVREQIPMMPSIVRIENNGTFRVEGLRPGKAMFNLSSGPGTIPLTLSRIERDGVRVDGIDVGPAEHVTGVRLVFAYGTGIVRGQVFVKGGGLPEGTVFHVNARRIPDGSGNGPSVRSDVRGFFALERLPPGQYELFVQPYVPNSPLPSELYRRIAAMKQNVTVGNGQTVPVNFTIDLTMPEQK